MISEEVTNDLVQVLRVALPFVGRYATTEIAAPIRQEIERALVAYEQESA